MHWPWRRWLEQALELGGKEIELRRLGLRQQRHLLLYARICSPLPQGGQFRRVNQRRDPLRLAQEGGKTKAPAEQEQLNIWVRPKVAFMRSRIQEKLSFTEGHI